MTLSRQVERPAPGREQEQEDFSISGCGSLYLLQSNTDAAREWVDAHIGQGNGYQPYWPTVVIEQTGETVTHHPDVDYSDYAALRDGDRDAIVYLPTC